MSSARLAGRRVMVVEDELLIAMLIEDMLTDQGCAIIGPFATVADALKAVRDEPMDLAVLDVNLRGERVYPVAEAMEARGIPFLLLSGYGDDAIPADRPGWKACSKPFEVDALLVLLEAQLGAQHG